MDAIKLPPANFRQIVIYVRWFFRGSDNNAANGERSPRHAELMRKSGKLRPGNFYRRGSHGSALVLINVVAYDAETYLDGAEEGGTLPGDG